ncbi:MAG TPA: ATP-binding protein [Kofleriaceae bacterium]
MTETSLPLDSSELFRLLLGSVRDYAIFMLDPAGRVATWNTGAERLKGYAASEIVGSHFSRFYPRVDVDAGKCEHELRVAAATGRFEDEGWRIKKDGSPFWANVVISAVRDDAGTLVGFSKVTRDLTERKRNEEERAARLAAEHASRAKDEFLALLGHELRNPLAPIVTAVELMRRRATGHEAELGIIERQVKHLTYLVDDLLDVSRVVNGKLELRRAPVDLRTAITNAVEIVQPMLEGRGHVLAVDVADAPVMIDGDEARLTQVVTNLLTNAAKYTPPGGHIELSLRATRATATLTVRDDGVGIAAEMLPRIFDLFEQGTQRLDRAAGGLGLGLAIVRSLVELHGGHVTANSDGAGCGSTFSISLPVARAATASEPDVPRRPKLAAATPRKILLVDDNADARSLLAELLVLSGHEVHDAADGDSALAILAGVIPDIAILDIGLPGMDGYELAAAIQTQLGERTPRLFALTGYGQETDRERSAATGFENHLVKPINVRKLLELIG